MTRHRRKNKRQTLHLTISASDVPVGHAGLHGAVVRWMEARLHASGLPSVDRLAAAGEGSDTPREFERSQTRWERLPMRTQRIDERDHQK